MAGNFNYPFINQFAHHGGTVRHHEQAGAGVTAAPYYGNPIFSQLNWMMQSQAAVHCKKINDMICLKSFCKKLLFNKSMFQSVKELS